MSHFKNQLIKSSAEESRDNSMTGGIIGRVINYHSPRGGEGDAAGSDQKAGRCFCERHQGKHMRVSERHTVDVEITTGHKIDVWNAVPCFMYAQGIIDHGFKKNDKVFIQFINGDRSQPVATAYYRPPNKLDNFWNSLTYRMADFVGDFIFDAVNIGGVVETAEEEVLEAEATE